jgi:hypothetical protein
MMKPILDLFSQIRTGTETAFENLTMVPLVREIPGGPDYDTLDEALQAKSAQVRERGQAGTVPELEFVNSGDRPVLILDGEELVGAKQNRILNLTVLAPAQKTIVIPVSCVEHGRWAYSSPVFEASPRAYYAEGRAAKMQAVSMSLGASGRAASDQGAVWDSVAVKAARMGGRSATGAMAAVFEAHAQPIEKYVTAFAPAGNQVGAAFAIGGRLVGLDVFDYPRTLAKLLPKLVRSYALDAIDEMLMPPGQPSILLDPVPLQYQVDAFLVDLSRASAQAFPAVGLGQDVRLSGNRLAGGGLVHEERVVHLAAFRTADRAEGPVFEGSRMRRASERGRGR